MENSPKEQARIRIEEEIRSNLRDMKKAIDHVLVRSDLVLSPEWTHDVSIGILELAAVSHAGMEMLINMKKTGV